MITVEGDNRTKVISIEGNIGAGKSTLINELRLARPGWIYVDEPIEEWEGTEGEPGLNILESYYKDKQKWAYKFQETAWKTRTRCMDQVLEGAPLGSVIILERSTTSDEKIFARMARDTGLLTEEEWQQYQSMKRAYINNEPDHMIYLRTEPNQCLSNIRKRNRLGEDNINEPYLRDIHNRHESWLAGGNVSLGYDKNTTEVVALIEQVVNNI